MKNNISIKRNGLAPVTRRIVIVDDHPILREGLAKLIDQQKDLSICGQFEEAGAAFDSMASLNPDLALVDISLKGSSGVELLKNIKAHYPKMLVLVLSMHDESLYAERVLRAGASGYIMKQEASEKVLEAIRKVLTGEIYLSEKMSAKLMHQLIGGRSNSSGSLMERLSDRELEVFGLIGQGRGTREIAEQLHLSVKTIESHRAHIKEKLNLKNATELVHRAIQMRGE
ncbi:MAG: response regulator transcription factor [Verrucomicrobiota bacterium]